MRDGLRLGPDIARFGNSLRLSVEAAPGQSGGPIVSNGKVVGIASQNYEINRIVYHIATPISLVEQELIKQNYNPYIGYGRKYRNGLFVGGIRLGVPQGQGVFKFQPGYDRIQDSKEAWTMVGNFEEGEAIGAHLLTGPQAKDNLPQQCELRFVKGRISEGKCSIYFSGFNTPMGEDPRIRRAREEGRREVALNESAGGKAYLVGRYNGLVVGGAASIFEASKYRFAPRLSEEHILPDGAGAFNVYGGTPLLRLVNWDQDIGNGPMVLSGNWMSGSFTGVGSVRMPNGSLLSGTFDQGYLMSGKATRATGEVFGSAIGFDYDIYTGEIQAGWKHGKGELRNERFKYSSSGVYRDDYLWDGVMTYIKDGEEFQIEYKDGKEIRTTKSKK